MGGIDAGEARPFRRPRRAVRKWAPCRRACGGPEPVFCLRGVLCAGLVQLDAGEDAAIAEAEAIQAGGGGEQEDSLAARGLQDVPGAVADSQLGPVVAANRRVKKAPRALCSSALSPADIVVPSQYGPGRALVADAGTHQDPWSGSGMDTAARQARALVGALVSGGSDWPGRYRSARRPPCPVTSSRSSRARV